MESHGRRDSLNTGWFRGILGMAKRYVYALILAALVTLQVSATPISGTITMSHVGYGAKDTMKIWGGGRSGLNVYAGVYMFNKTAGTGEGQLLNDSFIGGFCIDLAENVVGGSLAYDVLMPQDGPKPTTFLGGPMGQQKASYIAELWGRFFDPAWSTSSSYTLQQKRNAEAFAAAVWEIVYEDLPSSPAGWNVTTDGTSGKRGFKAVYLDYKQANSWLHSLDGTGPMANLRVLSYTGSQDFLVALPQVPIPEPAALAFIAMGFVLVANIKGYMLNA